MAIVGGPHMEYLCLSSVLLETVNITDITDCGSFLSFSAEGLFYFVHMLLCL